MDDNELPEVFNDRRVKPWVHPSHQMVGEPHYLDPRQVAYVVKEPALGVTGSKTPRWRVNMTKGSELGTGSTTGGTRPLRTRREALEAFEMVKGGSHPHEAEQTIMEARRDRERERREQRQYDRFKGYNQAVNPGSFGR